MAIDVNKSRRWGCQIAPMIESRESCWHFALDSILSTVVKISTSRVQMRIEQVCTPSLIRWPYVGQPRQIQSFTLTNFITTISIKVFFLFSVFHSLIFYSLDSASIAPPSLDKNPGKRQVAREKTVCLRVERAMSLGCFGLLALKWSMAAEFSSASTPRRRRSKSSSTTTAVPLRPLASFSPLHDSCSAYVRFGDRGH